MDHSHLLDVATELDVPVSSLSAAIKAAGPV